MTGIMDAHSHYMPPAVAANTAFFKVGWSDIDRQLRTMDEQGIEQALLLYPTSDAHLNMGGWTEVCRIYNEALGTVVKDHPDRFIGGGILPVNNPHRFGDELQHIQDLGLKVLSLASSYQGVYLDDLMFREVFEFAGKQGMPVHVHPQILSPIGEERVSDPLLSPVLEYVFDVSMCIGKMMMEGAFLEYPDVSYIFAHYGGVLPFVKERFDNTYGMLRKRGFVKDLQKIPGEYFANIYLDTSGSQSKASLQCALEVTDASHILFGSDFPANQNLSQSVDVIRQDGFPEGFKENILKNNLKNLVN